MIHNVCLSVFMSGTCLSRELTLHPSLLGLSQDLLSSISQLSYTLVCKTDRAKNTLSCYSTFEGSFVLA